jgi:hypothetical protein
MSTDRAEPQNSSQTRDREPDRSAHSAVRLRSKSPANSGEHANSAPRGSEFRGFSLLFAAVRGSLANRGASASAQFGPQAAVLCGPGMDPRPGCVAADLRCVCQSEGPVDRGGLPAVVVARRQGSTRLRGTGRAPCGLVVRRSGRESRGSRHRVAARRRLGRAPTFVGLAWGPVDQVGRASPESKDRRPPPPRSSSATGRGACRASAASRSPRARDTTRPMPFPHRLRDRSPRPSHRAASAHSKAA